MRPSSTYRRLRAYTLWTIVVIAAMLAVVVLIPLIRPIIERSAFAAIFAVSVTALGVTSAWLGWIIAARSVEGGTFPRGLTVAHVAVAVAATGIAVFGVESVPGDGGQFIFTYLAAFVMLIALIPPATVVNTKGILALALAVTAATIVNVAVFGEVTWDGLLALVLPSFLPAGGLFASLRLSVWYLQMTYKEIDSARLRADLAVAEERLRFSRDLHDIFGRTLTAVAVKSDLAAELAEHGRPDDAAREMRSVNALAQEALGEVRQVVAGYRAPGLGTELRGARALLESSGIEVRVVGEAEDVAPEVFAWVVREGVTNVLRHSAATRCAIRVGSDAVEIQNDGAVPGSAIALGSGLLGLQDRLHASGGTLDVRREGGEFTLRAQMGEQR